MLDSLLVQLFGREVTDKLAHVGFDDTDSVARVNAERLAEEAGIAPALARRIIAVAVESGHPTPVEEIRSDQEEPRADREEPPAVREEPRADRHVRRPFCRPQSPLTVPPSSPVGPQGDAGIAARPPAETREALSDEGATKTPEPAPDPGGRMGAEEGLDEPVLRSRGAPYVDAGLIFSIGNAIRSGRPAGMTVAVAEEILDPPSPGTEAPEAPSTEGKLNEEPAAAKTTLLQGSLWSFGIWSPETPASKGTADADRSATRKKSAARQGTSGPPARPVPRRRSGDGH